MKRYETMSKEDILEAIECANSETLNGVSNMLRCLKQEVEASQNTPDTVVKSMKRFHELIDEAYDKGYEKGKASMNIFDAIEQAYKNGYAAGVKSSKAYLWHNLVTNPEDLPDEFSCLRGPLLFAWHGSDGATWYETGWFYHTNADRPFFCSKTANSHFIGNGYREVFAWRYIDPVEERNENKK